jgi:coenzyme A diphosphatase NUDT7
LPGGKVDSEDLDVCQTAVRQSILILLSTLRPSQQLREAFEEIALPNRSEHVHVLGTLEPFLSLYRLTVTPVVAVLTDASLLDSLKPNEAEVERIFHHPLEAVLDPPFMQTWEKQLTSKGGPDWPYETDWHVCAFLAHSIINLDLTLPTEHKRCDLAPRIFVSNAPFSHNGDANQRPNLRYPGL